MKTIYQTALLLKNNLPAPKYKLFLSSLADDERLLLDHSLSDTYDTDFELAPAVFGIKSKAIKYQRLKKNLQEKIYDFTLFARPLSPLLQTEYDGYYELFKNELLVKLYGDLFTRQDLALPLMKKHFNLYYHHFLHSAVIFICEKLTSYYGVTNYDAIQLAYYKKIYEESIEANYIQNKSRYYFYTINEQFGKSQKVDKEIIMKEIEKYLVELSPYEGKIRSQTFHSDFYGLQMMYQHVQHNYEEVVIICDKMIDYLKTLPFKSIGPLRSVYLRKINHLIWIQKYGEAIIVLNEAIKMTIFGSKAWFTCQYLFVLIYIYKKEYAEANLFITNLHNNKSYKSGISVFKPYIGIVGVYLSIFKSMGAITEDSSKSSYNTQKYLNEYKNFTKDKSGMNIPIFIAQLLEAIVQRKEDDIIDRMEALKKYTSRYITQSSHIRSNCFIHMLLAVVKHNYHVVAIERHTKKYLDKLRDNPKINTEEPVEVELIPYEDIWAILMSYLSNRKIHSSKKQKML